jgi:predicted RNA-binding Zn-ribbon protein involved in translation (DUF1610 family)
MTKRCGKMTGEKIEDKVEKVESEEEQPQEEKIEIPCPRCGMKEMFLTKTKRSFAWKCKNCSFDSNKLSDVFSHPKKELIVAQKLKELCPHLLFVENTPIDSDLIAGKEGKSPVKYDCSVFFFGDKIDKIKVSILQNIDVDRYLTTEEQYLQGSMKVFEYLAKIDSLMIFYAPQEPVEEKRLGVASCKDLKKFAVEVKDRFGNQQLSIPKEIRPTLITFDREKIVSMLHRNLWKIIKERRYMF